jgi:hypothetical protein
MQASFGLDAASAHAASDRARESAFARTLQELLLAADTKIRECCARGEYHAFVDDLERKE